MGKVNNERRKQLFEEFKKRGVLHKPAIRVKKPKIVKPKQELTGCHCRDKYLNDLPKWWRDCPDCPLDTPAQEA